VNAFLGAFLCIYYIYIYMAAWKHKISCFVERVISAHIMRGC